MERQARQKRKATLVCLSASLSLITKEDMVARRWIDSNTQLVIEKPGLALPAHLKHSVRRVLDDEVLDVMLDVMSGHGSTLLVLTYPEASVKEVIKALRALDFEAKAAYEHVQSKFVVEAVSERQTLQDWVLQGQKGGARSVVASVDMVMFDIIYSSKAVFCRFEV